jgi:hypothetical protein
MTWKALAAAVAFALGGGIAIGYSIRPQPAVHAVQSDRTKATAEAATDQTVKAGPVKTTQTVEEFGDGTGPGATLVVSPAQRESPAGTTAVVPGRPGTGRLLRRTVTVTEQGPTTTETHAETRAQAETDRKLDLTITPPARTGWAFQAGVEDVLGARPVRLELRRRLFAGAWVGVAVVPSRRELGASLSLEF